MSSGAVDVSGGASVYVGTLMVGKEPPTLRGSKGVVMDAVRLELTYIH